MDREDVLHAYRKRKEEIESRLEEFEELGDSSEERLFRELVFVILSSQSAAKDAWNASKELEDRGLLDLEKEEIAEVLSKYDISYELDKASYIVENRSKLSQPSLADPEPGLKLKQKIDGDPEKTRLWLVGNLSGIGWKGASHFLRNTGNGEDLAIISSHLASIMNELGLLDSAEPPTSREEYFEAEEKLREFSEDTGIEPDALDLVLWSMRTGKVFR